VKTRRQLVFGDSEFSSFRVANRFLRKFQGTTTKKTQKLNNESSCQLLLLLNCGFFCDNPRHKKRKTKKKNNKKQGKNEDKKILRSQFFCLPIFSNVYRRKDYFERWARSFWAVDTRLYGPVDPPKKQTAAECATALFSFSAPFLAWSVLGNFAHSARSWRDSHSVPS
jgi:hypothetical protein